MTVPIPNARRQILAACGATGLYVALRPVLTLASEVETPPQSLGPFYPRELPLDHDNDLARVTGAPTGAQGTIAHVFGRIVDAAGRPVAGARVEIWQVNAFGRYHHPGDRRNVPLDPGFQGYGETTSNAAGEYRFRTIKPVPYPGRTAHIHFAISAPRGDARLVTQMYLDGEPGNARDPLLNAVRDPAARQSLIVGLRPAPELETGALAGMFPIKLGFNAMPKG